MRLRIAASIFTMLCTWVLWEMWIAHSEGEPTTRLIQAVLESNKLSECRAAAQGFSKERADHFRGAFKEPDYTVLSNDSSAMLFQKNGKKTPQQYVFYCLPPTVNPYQDSR